MLSATYLIVSVLSQSELGVIFSLRVYLLHEASLKLTFILSNWLLLCPVVLLLLFFSSLHHADTSTEGCDSDSRRDSYLRV